MATSNEPPPILHSEMPLWERISRVINITGFDDFKTKVQAKRAMPRSKRALDFEPQWEDLDHGLIHYSHLAALIDSYNGRLDHLRIYFNHIFHWPCGRFTPFAKALARCTDLREFECQNLRFHGDSKSNLKSLASALKRLTSLEVARLDGTLLTAVRPLLLNPNNALRSITIHEGRMQCYGFYPTDAYPNWNEELDLFIESCQKSALLQQLTLSTKKEGLTVAHIKALGQLVRHSSSLRHLELHTCRVSPGDGESLAFLAEDLKHNTSLKTLIITNTPRHGRNVIMEEISSFYSALQHNYLLENLRIDPWQQRCSIRDTMGAWETVRQRGQQEPMDETAQVYLAGIYFMLALNRSGRGKLLGPDVKPNMGDWIEAIANHSDLSVTYYFLRNNPSLCDTSAKEGSSANNRAKHSRTLGRDGAVQGGKRQRTACGF